MVSQTSLGKQMALSSLTPVILLLPLPPLRCSLLSSGQSTESLMVGHYMNCIMTHLGHSRYS